MSSGHGFLNPADSNSIDHQTLTKTPTATTVVLTTPVRRDDPVDIIGGVTAAGGVKPPGTITFTAFVGGIPFGSTTGTLSGGIALASFAANTLFPAPYTVVAQYNPSDPSYGASAASTALTVTPAIPVPGVVPTMTATPDPGVLGAPETLHVIATPPAGSSTPVGETMSFASGATALGTCVLAPAAAGTTACDLITSALPAGVDPITASYPGSTRYAAVDASTSVTINAPASPSPTATPTSGSPSSSASGTPTSSTSGGSTATSTSSSLAGSSAAPSSASGDPSNATASHTDAGSPVSRSAPLIAARASNGSSSRTAPGARLSLALRSRYGRLVSLENYRRPVGSSAPAG